MHRDSVKKQIYYTSLLNRILVDVHETLGYMEISHLEVMKCEDHRNVMCVSQRGSSHSLGLVFLGCLNLHATKPHTADRYPCAEGLRVMTLSKAMRGTRK